MSGKLLEPKLYDEAPSVCTKAGCGGTVLIPHEDGWQCFNCMKIMYRASEKLTNNVIKRYARDKN
jgi:ribosomal protein S27AE